MIDLNLCAHEALEEVGKICSEIGSGNVPKEREVETLAGAISELSRGLLLVNQQLDQMQTVLGELREK